MVLKPELKIDDRLEDGPIKDRGCTDIICCFLFIGFWVATIWFGLIFIKNGDLDKVMRPVDYDGNPCGMGKGANHPYLMFGALTTLKKDYLKSTVCVKTCPAAAGETMECLTNTAYPE